MAVISIIIPCYNVEKYIDRCMNSVCGQTIGIEHLQVILVNDDSTDGTLDKLQKWEQKYPQNIMVITYSKNIRQGGARNIGLTYASADYIGFLDSDDWIEADMYEELYKKMTEGTYDVVRGKFIREDHFGVDTSTILPQRDQEYFFEEADGFYIENYQHVGNNGEFGSICTGLYRKSILTGNEIRFPEGLAYEDNYWSAIVALYTKSCYIIDRVFYHYMTNDTSTVTDRNCEYHLDRLKIELMKLDYYEKAGILNSKAFREKIEWEFIRLYYLGTMFILFTRFDQVPVEIVNQMIQVVNERFPHWSENRYVEQIDPLNRFLLELLKVPDEISQEEITEIGVLYVNAWKECNDI